MAQKIRALDDRELEHVAGGRYLGPAFVYTIREGEDLSLLARRFGTSVSLLAELNGILGQDGFEAGKRILIPQR